ncbi:LacI family DNA-binding transcriptional regulator [Streptomyces sp. TRM66268-LWL]|uniref:LacI family DNA-binding transcriptional regulator n=1 Tax=Streptomyces polyasparticus TaxID=2767826 RepID=A0ABR7SC93_9ACTN|nr:LacI family DNA-binding transcriptional regulator [Streptomyces polyasparticus]
MRMAIARGWIHGGPGDRADVARFAGVSQATVPLVLNAECVRAGEAGGRRVLDAITRAGASPCVATADTGTRHRRSPSGARR